MAEITAWVTGEIKSGVTLSNLQAQIGNVTKEDKVTVKIISIGGDYREGMDIYSYLKSLPAEVTTVAVGTVASIATVVQLAGTIRVAEPSAKPLIHNPWGDTSGDAAAHFERAKALAEVEGELIDLYSKETGADKQTLSELMKENEFITIEQYKELGFVNSIVEPLRAVARFAESETKQPDHTLMSTINTKMAKVESFLARIGQKLGIKNEFESIKAMMLTLADGTTKINVATEAELPEIGNAVTMEDGSVAPDGEYTLQDGSTLVVADGVITETRDTIEDKESEEVKALKAENETLKNQVAEMEAKMDTYAKTVEEINAKLDATYTPPANRKPAFKAAAPQEKKTAFTKDDLKKKPNSKQ